MLKPSFGFDSPTFLSRPKLSVLVDPNVGLVTRRTGELVHSYIRVTERNFGVGKHEMPQVLALVTQQTIIIDPNDGLRLNKVVY